MDVKKDKEILITRTFDAPQELVFKAWTDPKMLANWYAPKDCSIDIFKFEAKTGGVFHHRINTPSGYQCVVKGVFDEVTPTKRLVYRLYFSDMQGNITKPDPQIHGDWPHESIVIVELESLGEKTVVTLRQNVSATLAEKTGALPSWHQMLDRLSSVFTADREIVTTRLLNAPRELVFNAFTDPKHVSNWWGPEGFRTTTEKMDVRAGGTWEFVMHGPDGRNYGNQILYEEVNKPSKLVYRHAGTGKDEDVQFHVVVTFEEQKDKTLLTLRAVFENKDKRDQAIRERGAVEGARQTLARFERHINTLV